MRLSSRCGQLRLSVLLLFAIVFAPRVYAQNRSSATTLRVKLDREVTSKSASSGDLLSARLMDPLKEGQTVVAPAGSRIDGYINSVQAKTIDEDGWLLLVFNRIQLPDGREIRTTASGSFFRVRRQSKPKDILIIGGLGLLGALLGGHDQRVTVGLGGALIGLVIVANKPNVGDDIRLRAGQIIRLRLNE